MRNIYTIATVITIALLLSACSGEGSFDNTEDKIIITNCEVYITAQENDLLIKDESNTTIKVTHDVNGTKKVCVLTGSAHIKRGAN